MMSQMVNKKGFEKREGTNINEENIKRFYEIEHINNLNISFYFISNCFFIKDVIKLNSPSLVWGAQNVEK